MAAPPPEISFLSLIDSTTIFSLFGVVAILGTAYTLSLLTLPHHSTPTAIRILFIWHSFSCLIHLIFEGSFLYNVFFSSIPTLSLPTYNHGVYSTEKFAEGGGGSLGVGNMGGAWDNMGMALGVPPQPLNFLGENRRLYGNAYANNWAGRLWMVYAQADRRWAGVDLTVVSLEILTVLLGVPGAAWCVWCLATRRRDAGFWCIVLATGEIYGGFMTFCPEWLTGNTYLDTSNPMFKWVFIVFFNMLWVVFPLYAIWWGYHDLLGGGREVVGNKPRVYDVDRKVGKFSVDGKVGRKDI